MLYIFVVCFFACNHNVWNNTINCGSRKFLQFSGGPREWLCLFMFVKGLFLVMRSINLKSDLSFLKILKYTCFYSVTGLIKLVQLFSFTLTASETRIWRVLGTPGNVCADVLGFDRCKTHPIPQHELLVVQWTLQKASG